MHEFEELGNPANRAHLKKPMSKQQRKDAGLERWVPDIDYGGQDQGGNDTNYRQRQPKAKAQRTAASTKESSWKKGSWSSKGKDWQWGTSAQHKDDDWWHS